METLTYSDELERIEKARQTLLEKVDDFQNFLASPKVFDEDMAFEQKLTDVQKSVTVLAELTVEPSLMMELRQAMARQGGQPQPQETIGKQATLTELVPESAFTLPKALISVAAILGCGVLIEQKLLPPISILAVIVAVLAFAFAPQLKQLITALTEKKEEGEKALTLEDIEKISSIFSEIRNKYVSAYFLIRWQGSPGEPIPEQWQHLGLDVALVNRGEYLRKTLLHEFLDKIGQIVNACERSIWQRKQLIISAMAQSAAMRMRG